MLSRDRSRIGSFLKPPTLARPDDFGSMIVRDGDPNTFGGFLQRPNLQLSNDFGRFGAYLKHPAPSIPSAFGLITRDFRGFGDADYPVDTTYGVDPSAIDYNPAPVNPDDYSVTVQALGVQDVPSGDTGGFDWGALANKLIAAGPSAIALAQRAGILNPQQAASLQSAVTGQGPRVPVNPTPKSTLASMGTGTMVLLGGAAIVAYKVFASRKGRGRRR